MPRCVHLHTQQIKVLFLVKGLGNACPALDREPVLEDTEAKGILGKDLPSWSLDREWGGGLLSRVGTKDEDSRCTGEHRVKMGWAQGEATAEAEKVKAGSPDQETHKTLPMGG